MLSFSCFFRASKPRWKNTPLPNANSVVYFVGSCAEYLNGLMYLDIENIALNVGPTPDPPKSVEGSPSKRRKFNAFVPQGAQSSAIASSSQTRYDFLS